MQKQEQVSSFLVRSRCSRTRLGTSGNNWDSKSATRKNLVSSTPTLLTAGPNHNGGNEHAEQQWRSLGTITATSISATNHTVARDPSTNTSNSNIKVTTPNTCL